MKKLLMILLVVFGHQMCAQKLVYNKTLTVDGKEFVTSKKIRKKGLTLDNKDNVNLKDGYKLFILRDATFDKEKLSEVLLNVFPRERIAELQGLSSNASPSFGLTWHIDQDGTICSVTYRLSIDNPITLIEFSNLEDEMKKLITVSDFVHEGTESPDYYSLTFHIKLSRVLEGSF